MEHLKKRCVFCRKLSIILLECPMCKKQFCINDRTPESHACQEIERYKEKPKFIEKITRPKMEQI